jgi:hypothetical protein
VYDLVNFLLPEKRYARLFTMDTIFGILVTKLGKLSGGDRRISAAEKDTTRMGLLS